MIENRNEIIYIHDNKVKNIYEYNLLHDIINPPKRAKNINRHYYPILYECINIRKGKAKFKNFQILLDSGCIYTTVMRRLVENLNIGKDAVMQWHTKSGNITTNHKVEVDFTLPALSETNVMTWNCHVDDYAKGRYDMILVRDILIELGLNLNVPNKLLKQMMNF